MTKYLDNEGLTHFTGKMKGYADGKAGEVDSKVTSHVDNRKNPHGVTKAQVELGNVDNVQQIPLSQKGFANGVATLNANGKVPVAQMPTTKTINGESIFGSGNLQLSASLYKIVDELPTTDIDTSKIYIVPASATTAKNNKTEYIYLGDPNKAYDESKWEKLGDEQKSSTVTTPGGSITVDTALIENSPNPVAGGVVKANVDEIKKKLDKKVESSDYNTKMTAIDSTLEELKKKETITVDDELKDSPNPVQNRAVNTAVNNLSSKVASKAESTDLNAATARITALETNAATTVTEEGEGNGISSISKSGNTITATKGTFLTSAAGLVTKGDLTTGLKSKADVNHNHDTKYAAMKHTHSEYALSSALNDYVTNDALGEKHFLTDTSPYEHVNEVQTTEPQSESGNGIASISKEGKILKVTKGKFLTAHQSLADYVNTVNVTEVANGNGIASIEKNGNTLTVTEGKFLTEHQSLDGYVNDVQESTLPSTDNMGVSDILKSGNILKVFRDRFVKQKTLLDYVKTENLGTAIDKYASGKGYLTKDNLKESLKETVTIKLVSDKSESDTNLNGAKVTVKSGDTTVSTQTWQGTPIKVEVPCDKEVTIDAAAVKMYMKPKVLKYIPSPLYNREVTFTYKALELGVFIIDTNDNLINKDSWSSAMQETTVGVALITEKVAIVISTGIHTDLSWSETEQLVGGVTTTTDKTVAETDYKGKANTEAIVKALGQSAPAAYYCSNYTFKNGKKGYLMAGGESKEIFVNIQKIFELLKYINTDTSNIANGYKVWTSTQYDDIGAWNNDGISLRRLSKIVSSYYVVPIYSLYD